MALCHNNTWYKGRSSRRMTVFACTIIVLSILSFGLVYWNPEVRIPSWSSYGDTSSVVASVPLAAWPLPVMQRVDGRVDICNQDQVAGVTAYDAIRKKYDHLKDDKFTYVTSLKLCPLSRR